MYRQHMDCQNVGNVLAIYCQHKGCITLATYGGNIGLCALAHYCESIGSRFPIYCQNIDNLFIQYVSNILPIGYIFARAVAAETGVAFKTVT